MQSDARLRENVEEELACEPSVNSTAIGIAVQDGIVTLFGHVSSYAEKIAVEQAVGRVLGVKAIATELTVELTGSIQVSDEDIARAAIDALSWNSVIPADRIRVQVGSGWVTLSGEVDWQYQRVAAYTSVCSLKGVKGISNNVMVKPEGIRELVRAHIESALRRTFGQRGNRIRVETRRDHVVLWGTVNSLAERAEAERAAWTTPGVCHVENHLSVDGSAARQRERHGPAMR